MLNDELRSALRDAAEQVPASSLQSAHRRVLQRSVAVKRRRQALAGAAAVVLLVSLVSTRLQFGASKDMSATQEKAPVVESSAQMVASDVSETSGSTAKELAGISPGVPSFGATIAYPSPVVDLPGARLLFSGPGSSTYQVPTEVGTFIVRLTVLSSAASSVQAYSTTQVLDIDGVQVVAEFLQGDFEAAHSVLKHVVLSNVGMTAPR